ncbi:hypothetical protein CFBP2533_40820 [Xanthomonas hortorum pv. pelargonii]|uniref:Uncharacterized protein n=1 Tax=Xanthomonas hortorum pv. pelargonii TaxID=453602 RepID=A0A6V7EY33_9XANT|nr:hypothetical protein CFBP2533_40820 [Xanthomonas hortorum pv. pelargonii]CAD0356193.1 hypothetical protein CFBP2533_40820 [Xanthomonas hortorum pv. pelargonii]
MASRLASPRRQFAGCRAAGARPVAVDGWRAPAVVELGVRGAGVFLARVRQHLAAVHAAVLSGVPAAERAHVAGAARHPVSLCLGDGRAQCRVVAGVSLRHQLFRVRLSELAPVHAACGVATLRDAGGDERAVPGLGALAGDAPAVAGVAAGVGAGHGCGWGCLQHQRTQGRVAKAVAGRSTSIGRHRRARAHRARPARSARPQLVVGGAQVRSGRA